MDKKTDEAKEKKAPKAAPKINKWRVFSIILIVIMGVAAILFYDYVDSQAKNISKTELALKKESIRVRELETELKNAHIETRRAIGTYEIYKKQKEEEEEERRVQEEQEQKEKEEAAKNARPTTLVFESLRNYVGSDWIVPEKIDFTKDGKYLYVIGNVYIDNVGAYGIWYKEANSSSGWKRQVFTNSTAGLCSNYADEQIKFFEKYYYISEGLGGSGRIGCYKTEKDAENNKLYPYVEEN